MLIRTNTLESRRKSLPTYATEPGRAAEVRLARKLFIKEHGTLNKSDERRERFVSLCHDVDVQKLTFDAYMNKNLVHARPLAHLKIGFKNVRHRMGWVAPEHV